MIWLVLAGILLCRTIIGIPLGLASFKMVPLALLPFGKTVVPIDAVAGRELVVGPVRSP